MELHRRDDIGLEVSVVRDIREKELWLYTDADCVCQPLFIVENGVFVLRREHIILGIPSSRAVKSGILTQRKNITPDDLVESHFARQGIKTPTLKMTSTSPYAMRCEKAEPMTTYILWHNRVMNNRPVQIYYRYSNSSEGISSVSMSSILMAMWAKRTNRWKFGAGLTPTTNIRDRFIHNIVIYWVVMLANPPIYHLIEGDI